jgi:hypothetical protein
MTAMVQVAVAADVTEAEEIQTILREVGIPSELQTAVEHHPTATDNVPQKILVPERDLEAAQDAIEAAAATEEDEPLGA